MLPIKQHNEKKKKKKMSSGKTNENYSKYMNIYVYIDGLSLINSIIWHKTIEPKEVQC
jgi:hypothetical protein